MLISILLQEAQQANPRGMWSSLIWILLLIILSVICLIVNLYSAPIFLIVSGILFAVLRFIDE